ncbi:MAG: hypothetical protein WD069_06885 [Planctomycetales bacterium]
MTSAPIRVLLWGDPTTEEMRPLAVHLLTLPVAIVSCRDPLGFESAALSFDGEPELVIALQSWPDEFPRSVVERAIGRFPLARWVCCYGAWCASDGRTRDIWPNAARVPVEAAPARIARELSVLRGELFPLPLTASRDEAFAFDLAEVAGMGELRRADERRCAEQITVQRGSPP